LIHFYKRFSRMAKAFSRLPSSVVPTNYKIHLTPDLKNFTFKGECAVSVTVKEPVDQVICNALDMTVDSGVVVVDGQELVAKIEFNKDEEKLMLKFDKPLSPGEAVVKFKYVGNLNDQMKGFYRAKYFVNGEERFAASTQFESTDARRAFPCWDEPAVKATFDVTITGPKDRVILSNMPEVSSVEDGNQKTITFDRTPIMSTYLVAMIVGEFDYVESQTSDGIKVRVYTPLGKKEQGQFALECGVRCLDYYSSFFNIPYPLKKYDMIGIPDFSMGAMENWGLVTYRESCILVDAQNTSATSKEYVAIVVAHETAHQWFGNLVTMEWWTHLWLNEGFASFMENLCTNELYPDFKVFDTFVPMTLIRALELDSLASSHPIEVPVGHPSEVDEIFDVISYNKGASVIRMLYNWIGEDAFKAGMKAYLTKYSYQNTETPQLWAELEEASGQPVKKVMATWTEQMGFPVISVKSRQEGSDRIVHLSQTKFTAGLSSSTAGDVAKYFWNIPISIKLPSGEIIKIMMDQQSMDVTLPDLAPDAYFKLNPEVVGYFRVHYSPEDLDRLCTAVQKKELSPLDRLNVLDDVFSLISAGKATSTDGLKLLQAFKDEDCYVVWNSISNAINSMSTILLDQTCYENFKRFVLDIFSTVKTKVTWDGPADESHLQTLLRCIVLSKLGRYGDTEVIDEAKRRFDAHVAGTKSIHADMRATVYTCVGALGQASDYETMVKLHNKEELSEEKDRIMRSGLGGFLNKELIEKALHFSLTPEVRAQDSPFLIMCVSRNPMGKTLAWQFFKDNLPELMKRYESGGGLLSRVVKVVVEGFATEDMANTAQKYFEEHPIQGTDRNVAQACETVRVNAAWLDRDLAAIKAYLDKY
jgi:puromycin-sensitive aminopeptidase